MSGSPQHRKRTGPVIALALTAILLTAIVARTAPASVLIQQAPAAPSTQLPPATSANDDAALQQKLDKAFAGDTEISAAAIEATVVNGKAVLIGTVNTNALRQRAERLASAIKGVRRVENKIVISP